MRSLVLGTALLTLGFAGSVSAQATVCPISGFTSQNYGQGCGAFPGAPPTLKLGWDAAGCAIDVQVSALQCCNTWVSQHWILYGQSGPVGFALPEPFWFTGCFLWLVPIDALPGAPGTQSKIVVPTNPALVGQTFQLQAMLEYVTFGQFDAFGMTDAVQLTFF